MESLYRQLFFKDKGQRNETGCREEYGGQGKYLFVNIDDSKACLYTDRNN